MFTSIRKSLASFIAPAAVVVHVPEGARSLTTPTVQQIPMHVRTQAQRARPEELTNGKFHASQLGLINSAYLKDALAQLGAWSCLARVFSEYERQYGRKNQNTTAYEQLITEFHEWNANTSEGKQMDEETIILTLDKLSDPVVPRGDKTTDAIIARVRKCSVAEVAEDRIAKAEKKSALRKDMIGALVNELNQYETGDCDPSISSAKACAKAIQTLEWIATSWQGEPAGIAAELLLIEEDIKTLEALARKESDHEGESNL